MSAQNSLEIPTEGKKIPLWETAAILISMAMLLLNGLTQPSNNTCLNKPTTTQQCIQIQ